MTDKQIDKQLDEMLATLAKLHDQIVSLKRKVAGENPIGDVLAHYDAEWRRLYSGRDATVRYDFVAGEPKHVERLLKVMDATTLKHRMSRYFNDRDTWLVQQRHPFNVFLKRLSTYSGGALKPAALTLEPVVGCEHNPPCGTDAEHTKRRMEEMRHVE